jgi:hypothetical protein
MIKRYLVPAMILLFVLSAISFLVRASYGLRFQPDFIPVYAGARCLIVGCNPYDTDQLEALYVQQGVPTEELMSWDSSLPVYPPSTFVLLAPIAAMPYTAARLCWFLLLGLLYVTATAAIFQMCPREHRVLALLLCSWMMIRSSRSLMIGQPVVLAVALLGIGCALLFHKRLLWLGAVCLALSVAVKPHIGLLVVSFLAIRGIHRKYAFFALTGALGLLLLGGGILSSRAASGHWISDLRTNMATAGLTDRPSDPTPHLNWVARVDLQSLFAVFTHNPATYRWLTYAVFLAVVMLFAMSLTRFKLGKDAGLVALAALAGISLMPVYHSNADVVMMMIAIPGVVVVWHRNRKLGGAAAVLLFLILSPIQWKMQGWFLSHPRWQPILDNRLVYALLLRQQVLFLVLLTCVLLWAMKMSEKNPTSIVQVR